MVLDCMELGGGALVAGAAGAAASAASTAFAISDIQAAIEEQCWKGKRMQFRGGC